MGNQECRPVLIQPPVFQDGNCYTRLVISFVFSSPERFRMNRHRPLSYTRNPVIVIGVFVEANRGLTAICSRYS